MGSKVEISKASSRREKLQRFPDYLETYRTCLRDIFDIETLKTILTKLRDRSMSIQEVETDMASPLRALLSSTTSPPGFTKAMRHWLNGVPGTYPRSQPSA